MSTHPRRTRRRLRTMLTIWRTREKGVIQTAAGSSPQPITRGWGSGTMELDDKRAGAVAARPSPMRYFVGLLGSAYSSGRLRTALQGGVRPGCVLRATRCKQMGAESARFHRRQTTPCIATLQPGRERLAGSVGSRGRLSCVQQEPNLVKCRSRRGWKRSDFVSSQRSIVM